MSVASADFRVHVLAHLQHSTYRLFSPRFVRLFVVTLLPADVSVTAHISASLDHRPDAFIALEDVTPAEAARRLEAARIQLLLWVSEPGEGLRTLLGIQRPVPVSTHHLAVPATTGVEGVHYFSLDRATAAFPSAARSISERALVLPHHYQVNSHASGLGPTGSEQLPSTRAGWRWPVSSIANFGQITRLDPTLIDTLRHVLLNTNTLLWLAAPGPLPRLRAELAALGIHERSRCIISPRLGWQAYAARAAVATLYVDTFHYNSHTTTVDMLWAGTPTVTTIGGSFTARVGAAVSRAAGLPGTAATSLRQYSMTVQSLTGVG